MVITESFVMTNESSKLVDVNFRPIRIDMAVASTLNRMKRNCAYSKLARLSVELTTVRYADPVQST